MLPERGQQKSASGLKWTASRDGMSAHALNKRMLSSVQTCLLPCQSAPLGLKRPDLIGNVKHISHLEEQILTPLSALGFQHCCLAQCPPPDGLIKSLEERVASHFSGPYLSAIRNYELIITTRLLRIVNPGGLRQQRQQEQHICAGVQRIEAHWCHNAAEVYR